MKKQVITLLIFSFTSTLLLAQWQTVITPNKEFVQFIDGEENKILFFKSELDEFISNDGGKTWDSVENLSSAGDCINQDSIFFLKGNGFRMGNNKLFKSCSFSAPTGAKYSAEYNNVVYFQKFPVGGNGGTAYFSDDKTKNWQQFFLPKSPKGLASTLFANEKQLVAANLDLGPDSQTNFNIYYSNNQGSTWSNALYNVTTWSSGGSGSKLNSLFLLDNEIVIVGESGGVMVFVDFTTKNVRKTDKSIIKTQTQFNRAVQRNGILFAQVNSSYIYYSADKGYTWTNISGNLPVSYINSLSIVGNKLYVSVDNQVYTLEIGSLTSEKNTITLQDNLIVFPNPSTEDIFVQLKNNDMTNATVEIFDLWGRKMLQQQASSRINIASLSKGIYVFKMEQNGKNWIKKFEKI